MEQTEQCKVYKSETSAGTDTDRPPDILIDDKSDVVRMADDIDEHGVNGGASTATAATTNSGTNSKPVKIGSSTQTVPLTPNAAFLFHPDGHRHKTAFNTVSPSYASNLHSHQAQLFQYLTAPHYNGFLNSRYFVSPHHMTGLGSPSLGSPTYVSALNGVYSAHPWFSAFSLDPSKAAAAAVAYAPFLMGLSHHAAAQISPSFTASPMDQLHMGMSASSFFNPSPLHSPDTGTPIVPLGLQVPPALSLASLKLSVPGGAGAMPGSAAANLFNAPGMGGSPSFANPVAPQPPPNLVPPPHSLSSTNHLTAMRQIPVPSVTLTAPSFATTLNVVCNGGGADMSARSSNDAKPQVHHKSNSNSFIDQSKKILHNNNNNSESHMTNGTSVSSHASTASSSTFHQRMGATLNAVASGSAACSAHSHTSYSHGHSHNIHHISLKCTKDAKKQQPHIKKPLNAFMLYMKEMRPNILQEDGLKERQSAEINRTLGRRWHMLSREEQQKYYDMAKKERQEHLHKYPTWSARDNYAINKKKKRKRDKAQDNLEAKKCRARFGLDQQGKWCKHCRRKKKCLWFKETDLNIGDGIDASPAAQVSSTSHNFDDENQPFCTTERCRSGGGPSTSTSTGSIHHHAHHQYPLNQLNSSKAVGGVSIAEGSPQGHVSSTTAAQGPAGVTAIAAAAVCSKDTQQKKSCDEQDDDDESSVASQDLDITSEDDQYVDDVTGAGCTSNSCCSNNSSGSGSPASLIVDDLPPPAQQSSAAPSLQQQIRLPTMLVNRHHPAPIFKASPAAPIAEHTKH